VFSKEMFYINESLLNPYKFPGSQAKVHFACLPRGKLMYEIFVVQSGDNVFSIDRIARPQNLSWDMVDLKLFLINFSLEKLLSALATVAGTVNNILYTIAVFGNESLMVQRY
jgi:hypothetical protein